MRRLAPDTQHPTPNTQVAAFPSRACCGTIDLMLEAWFVTLFPEMLLPATQHSMLARAVAKGLVRFDAVNPRDFAQDRHRTVDDTPFGGGPGMLMTPGPVSAAIDSLSPSDEDAVVFLDPTGELFTQRHAVELARYRRLVLVCGHYEGIDERVRQIYATHTLSIGDYVLTGGELASLVIADAVVRQIPGVLGDEESLAIDSHSDGLLSAPQYTRPADFRGLQVPEVLMSGDHGAIERWKRAASLRATRESRPDLFPLAKLDKRDLDLL